MPCSKLVSVFHFQKIQWQNQPILLLLLSHAKLHLRCHCSLLGLTVWFSFSLENHLPFCLLFSFAELRFALGLVTRVTQQNISAACPQVYNMNSDVITSTSFSAESPDSSKVGKWHLIVVTQSLTEIDGSKPESQSTWWITL